MSSQETTHALPSPREEIPYLHTLRVLATLAVVVMHVTSKDFSVPATNTAAWQIFNVYDSLSRWAVPVFVMISGALFLDPARELPLKKLFGKYMLRILTALIFWSAAYAVAYTGIYLRGTPLEIWGAFLTGHDHLWYLYMLLGLYLAVPVMRKVAESPTVSRYFLALFFFFSVLLPALGKFEPFAVLRYQFSRLEVHLFLRYVGYLLLGYRLHSVSLSRRTRFLLYALGLLASAVTVLVSGLVSARTGTLYTWLYDYFSPCTALQSVAVFVLVKSLPRHSASGLIRLLSRYSFGIYLVHEFFVDALRRFCGLSTLAFTPVLSIPVIAVLTFALSALVSAVIHRIPVLKKYIV